MRLWNTIRQWLARRHQPTQLSLRFFEPYCGFSGKACVYRNEADELHPSSGFYGVCWRCGETYDPGCDR